MKNTKKMSRREREEQRQMRRIMIFGGGAFAVAAAAGVGVTMLPASFPSIDGSGTMKDRIAAAGLTDHVIRLTPKTAGDDVLIVGTTDCSHCRNFVENGLEDAVSFAEKEGLGLVYAPTGSSKSSLGSSQILGCLAKAKSADPAEMIRAVYDNSTKLGDDEGVEDVIMDLGAKFGLSEDQIAACIAESPLEVTGRVQALGRAFPVRGTPIFFVASKVNPETISWFSGWAGTSGLRGQISNARNI